MPTSVPFNAADEGLASDGRAVPATSIMRSRTCRPLLGSSRRWNVVSVSRAKLLVPLDEWQVLNSLTPDFDAVWNLCDTYGASGLYPFTRNTDKKNAYAAARQFPVRAGFPEDSATGVAAAALGAYLTRCDLSCRPGTHEFLIAQGYAMGAPSVIEAILDCVDGQITRTAIRGMAHILSDERVAV
jgi:PhzF family phenazine biosynthesis protein